MDNARFQNYGCKYISGELSNYFNCANRKDKANFLFDFDQKAHQQGRNYNAELSFDSEMIYCQTHNFSYAKFMQVAGYQYPKDQCILKDGQTIPLIDLLIDLLTDFTFKYSSKIAQY